VCIEKGVCRHLQSVAERDRAPKRDSASCSLGIYAVKRGVHARLSVKCWGMTFSKGPPGVPFRKKLRRGSQKKISNVFQNDPQGVHFEDVIDEHGEPGGRFGRTFYKMTPRGCILKGLVGNPPHVN
jgi:hypothetical protein